MDFLDVTNLGENLPRKILVASVLISHVLPWLSILILISQVHVAFPSQVLLNHKKIKNIL